MPDIKHYWRPLYAGTYISMGVLAFFLPTHEPAEIIMRIIFILLGLGLIFLPKWTVKLLIAGITILTFWIFLAFALISLHWHDPIYRVHLFTLPLWFFFMVKHYKAIRELSE